jgi:Dinucleotide-utilizing enzymes involved in molybdopterin and thiamine biosynthesis family 2
MDRLYHERLHRTDAVMARIKTLPVTVCGAGALGANLTENLARQGFEKLTVIDRDRVEEHNLSTQPWHRSDIGAFKAKLLANSLFRALGVAAVTAKSEEMTADNAAKQLGGAALVVDTFDNSASRQAVSDACRDAGIPCLHVGLSGESYAEVIWDEVYTVPPDAGVDACDYPLARNLTLLAVAVASEVIVEFAADASGRTRRSLTLTLGDFAVRPYEAG